MLVNFKIKNYRSFKDEVSFSMEADVSKLKTANVADIQLPNSNNIRILKMAMVYGANASGKSNLIRAFYSLIRYILSKPNVGEGVELYEPFLFDTNTIDSNSKFEIDFIGPKSIKHTYTVIFDRKKIIEEELNYFPNGRITNLFSRSSSSGPDSNIHVGILGSILGRKEIKVFNNQLLLSKFGSDEPNTELTEIFLYFKKYEVINSLNAVRRSVIQKEVSELLYSNEILKNKMNSLLRFADTKLKGVIIQEKQDHSLNEEIKRNPLYSQHLLFGVHALYDSSNNTGDYRQLLFSQESMGTQILYSIGGKVLLAIENGGILIIDELDMSLHPFLTRMIIYMFQSSKLNPHNAQLIFTSHDMTLLDRDLVRRDQVWIAEKKENGTSEMFSIQDFEGVREETPFDKWYLAGKFGGLPSLKSIDSMFEEDAAN